MRARSHHVTATTSDTLFSRYDELPDGFSGDRWLPWKPAGRHKIPLGRNGQPCDPAIADNWLPYQEARQVSRILGDSGPRIGYALPGSGIVALDWDRVVDGCTGEIDSQVHAMIEDFQSYAELSPGGRGVHIYVAADLAIGNRRVAGLELVTKGFITVTGHPIRRGAIGAGGDPLQRIIDALPPIATTAHASRTAIPVPLPQLVRSHRAKMGRASGKARRAAVTRP
jgi:primase-polymerase (primpol)-like protein